jgi:hypothetical protein
VGGIGVWEGTGGALCGNSIDVKLACSGDNTWSLSVTPLAMSCVAGEVTFQVLNSNPIRVNFEYVPPAGCCQTNPIDGTINE